MDANHGWVERWFNAVWAKSNEAQLRALAAEPLQFHLPGGKSYSLSHDDYLSMLSIWNQRFRDAEFQLKDIIQQGEKTVVLYQCSAYYTGGWARVPKKKQRVHMTGMLYLKQEAGMISECWLEDSSFDVYQQLTQYLD
ncbi:ester cyclase [Photobacterium aphoticum]|uniref:SnoaL-like domain-containing protein n=2 Tax=Photobacterium aphoticum TaxID=754436 RepID=A0A0J1JFD0_9GAMM|nr:nuclear transport factor 2 family protein [Photobacterium aphoticum]KLV00392.1 hypothetical protein ABT58_12005 [Photobacterium aphoticum]PSU59731.1 nuclear transport factor 2 family protein [Photobacterium aphoticum]GHA42833.1 hypothetical protein GCM10007086_15580 [Photobacterium aphoticum]